MNAPEGQTIIYPPTKCNLCTTFANGKWKKDKNAASYWLQLSSNSSFNGLILDQRELLILFLTIGPFAYSSNYYLRVRGEGELGLSPEWSYISNFTTVNPPTIGVPCPGAESVVYEGRIYHTIKIGNTCWFKENLDIGEMIPSSQTQTNNTIIEKYCYNNVAANCTEYGGLYQWKEAMQYSSPTLQGVKGICPDGWKIATRTNIDEIVNCANNKFSSILATGSNETGFSAKLGGYSYSGFSGIGSSTRIWSDFGFSPDGSLVVFLLKIDNTASNWYNDGGGANSVRCVKPAL